tara:strand:+ start:202 stop:1077 length:876 start_codon:yes stop_codon:yes gene_type:complete
MKKIIENTSPSVYSFMSVISHLVSYNRRNKISASSGLKPLIINDLIHKKKSDTLFILGSGSSINHISDKLWHRISEMDSIGLNFWILHDFVPTFLKFELPLRDNQERSKLFSEYFEDKWQLYEKSTLIYNHYNDEQPLPAFIKSKLEIKDFYFPKYLYVPGTLESTVEMNLNSYFNYIKFFQSKSILFAKTGSLISTISIGLLLDYKNIVLCGVDLSDTKYFFDDNYYKSKFPDIDADQPGEVHLTIDKSKKSITIDTIIKILNYINVKRGNNIFIENSSSVLSNILPVYN